MKLFFAGDIVGSPGRTLFARTATLLRSAGRADAVVANAENAAAGKGITPALAGELLAAGADALTLGDHAWDRRELAPAIDAVPRIVRPANFAPGCPGTGVITVETEAGALTVINLVGRVFMKAADCPFRTVDRILSTTPGLARVIVVDLHAEATSEKVAMGRHLDGRVSAVIGTHTHIPTADEKILPGGTAYITDAGMTGPKDSVIGRETESVLRMFRTGMPSRFKVAAADRDVTCEGVLIDLDAATGRARRIRRVREGDAPDGS